MIDLHIHILPGIDDGPADAAGTVELARACVADGVQAVAATPHVSEHYFNSPERIQQALGEARAAVKEAGVGLKIYGGAELAIDQMARLSDEDLSALTLGPGGSYALLEAPYAAWPMELESQAGRLATLGVRSILAHPERSAGVQSAGGIEKLEAAVARGVCVQITAGSLSGRFGGTAQATARRLLDLGLVHMIASDAHNTDRRPPRIGEAAKSLGDPQLAQWLTVDVPLAIVSGERLPERPPAAPRRRRKIFGRG